MVEAVGAMSAPGPPLAACAECTISKPGSDCASAPGSRMNAIARRFDDHRGLCPGAMVGGDQNLPVGDRTDQSRKHEHARHAGEYRHPTRPRGSMPRDREPNNAAATSGSSLSCAGTASSGNRPASCFDCDTLSVSPDATRSHRPGEDRRYAPEAPRRAASRHPPAARRAGRSVHRSHEPTHRAPPR